MSNSLNVIRAYIERNPKLSDEDISLKLGVSKKKILKARSEITNTTSVENSSDKIIAGKSTIDVVDNPAEALKQKIRQLDHTFEVSRLEFLLDPNSDNAHNMSIMLNDIKATLKELDGFTDLSVLADLIVQNILMPHTKNIINITYNHVKKFTDELSDYLPKSIRCSASEYTNDCMTGIGKDTKKMYDESIDELEKIVRVPLDKYRVQERVEPLKLPRKIKSK